MLERGVPDLFLGRSQHAEELGSAPSKPEEAEDVFFHEPLIVRSDHRHSKRGKRTITRLDERTPNGACFWAFTVRRNRIRVISVHDLRPGRKRRSLPNYAHYEKENP